MFEHHFGLRENPFVAGHHARFVYPSPEHQEALAHLRFGIENREPFVLITGEVGTGKTTAIYDALSEWQTRVVVALITNSALTRNELLEEIALRFGVSMAGGTSKPQLIAQLERFLLGVHQRGDRAILLLDEGQNLERDLLEEIRLLSNLETAGQKLMQVFLVGQPELEAKLARPELRQLRQRITVHYRLSPLSAEDAERYIHHRIGVAGGHALTIFPADACREVYHLTHGIPREINNVCAQALLNAFVDDKHSVSPEHVRSAADDTEFQSVIVRGSESLPGQATVDPAAMGKVEVISSPAEAKPFDPPELGDVELDEEFEDEPELEEFIETPKVPRAQGPPSWTPVEAPVTAPTPIAPAPPALLVPSVTESPGTAPAPFEPLAIPAIDSWMSSRAGTRDRSDGAPPEPATPPAEVAPSASSSGEPPSAQPPPPRAVLQPTPISRAAAAASPPPPAAPAEVPWLTPIAPAPSSPRSLADEQRAALPPRLREKMGAMNEEPEGGSRTAIRWLAAAGVVAVVVIGGVLLMRLGPWAIKPRPAAEAVVPIEPPTAPSAIRPEHAPADGEPEARATETASSSAPTHDRIPRPSPAIATHETTGGSGTIESASHSPEIATPTARTTTVGTEAFVSPARHKPGAPSAGTAAATASRPATTRSAFGVAVGGYLFEDRAGVEREKLAASTGLTARVVTVKEDGTEIYRLVLGAFPDRDAAERGASDLIRRGLVDEARVVPLPRSAPAKP